MSHKISNIRKFHVKKKEDVKPEQVYIPQSSFKRAMSVTPHPVSKPNTTEEYLQKLKEEL